MKFINWKTVSVLAALLITGTVKADESMSVTNQPSLPMMGQQFVTDAAIAGMVEVHVSRVALEKSSDADIRKFANLMIKDHTAANQKLHKIAMDEGLDFPATNMFSAEDPNWNNPMVTRPEEVKGAQLLMSTNLGAMAGYRAIQHLKSLNDGEFDRAYWDSMMADHMAVISEFEMAAANLSDPKLKQFAEKTLPTLRKHCKMAQDYDSKHDSTHDMNGQSYGRTNHMGQPVESPIMMTPR